MLFLVVLTWPLNRKDDEILGHCAPDACGRRHHLHVRMFLSNGNQMELHRSIQVLGLDRNAR